MTICRAMNVEDQKDSSDNIIDEQDAKMRQEEDDKSRCKIQKQINQRYDNMFKTIKSLIKAAIAGAVLTTVIRSINNRIGKSKNMQGNGKKK